LDPVNARLRTTFDLRYRNGSGETGEAVIGHAPTEKFGGADVPSNVAPDVEGRVRGARISFDDEVNAAGEYWVISLKARRIDGSGPITLATLSTEPGFGQFQSVEMQAAAGYAQEIEQSAALTLSFEEAGTGLVAPLPAFCLTVTLYEVPATPPEIIA